MHRGISGAYPAIKKAVLSHVAIAFCTNRTFPTQKPFGENDRVSGLNWSVSLFGFPRDQTPESLTRVQAVLFCKFTEHEQKYVLAQLCARDCGQHGCLTHPWASQVAKGTTPRARFKPQLCLRQTVHQFLNGFAPHHPRLQNEHDYCAYFQGLV